MLHNLATFFITSSMKNNREAELLPHTPLSDLDKQDMLESAVYGLEIFLSSAINLIITCILGILFAKIPETIIFLLSFCILRQHVGGYHAPNYFLCGLLFQTIYCFIILNNIVFNSWIAYLAFMISWSLLWLHAPVEDLNKPLDPERKEIMKKRARKILLAEAVFFIISVFLRFELVSKYMVYAVCFCVLLMVAGKIKNYRLDESTKTLQSNERLM